MTGFGQDKIQQVRKAQFNFSFSSLVGVNIRSNLQPPCNVRDQWRALESRCVLAGGRPPTDAPDHCSGARLDSSDWAVGRGEIEWEGLSFTPVSPLSSIYYWEAWKIPSTNWTTHLILMTWLRQFSASPQPLTPIYALHWPISRGRLFHGRIHSGGLHSRQSLAAWNRVSCLFLLPSHSGVGGEVVKRSVGPEVVHIHH